MIYHPLGRTGVQVSCLCLGTMLFGKETGEEAAAAMVHRCREAGVNFFDTADVYNQGRSEEILGRLIKEEREEIILVSKVCFPTGPDVNASGLSRRHIRSAVEASLRRLHTDHLDLYFLHNYDPKTPIEEPLRALDDLVHQGKILYPAVSNWAAWQTMKGLGIAAREGLSRFECLQPMYNLSEAAGGGRIAAPGGIRRTGGHDLQSSGRGAFERKVRGEQQTAAWPPD